MLFHKFQALGNDFLIVREAELKTITNNYSEFAQRICDRHFGAGADGLEIILAQNPSPDADFAVRLYNADGGETPISGNGTRCVGAYLSVFGGWIKPKVKIATGAGTKALSLIEREGTRCRFNMEMGTPRFASHEIPVNVALPLEQVIEQKLNLEGHEIEFTATSIGNPHCSIFVDDFDQLDWRKLGSLIEKHPIFPERTNVEFVRLLNRSEIEVRFWERGVGETLASGTGSCGASLAAMLNNFVERKVTVKTAAGKLQVEWQPNNIVTQIGEARAVYSAEWLR